MSTINPSLVSSAIQTPAAPTASQPQATPPQTNTNTFGDAVNVDLSAPAQAVVASGNTSSGTPVAAQPSVPDVAQLVSAAKQKVIPQVGVSGASDVVDSQGNISKSRLAVEIAEQAQKG